MRTGEPLPRSWPGLALLDWGQAPFRSRSSRRKIIRRLHRPHGQAAPSAQVVSIRSGASPAPLEISPLWRLRRPRQAQTMSSFRVNVCKRCPSIQNEGSETQRERQIRIGESVESRLQLPQPIELSSSRESFTRIALSSS
jgi:hypothetical protein